MVEVIDLCTDCVQVITNPICPVCFSNHVTSWLRDKDLPKEKIIKIEKNLIKLIISAEDTPSNINCIICGSKRVNLCIYCFTLKATRILEKSIEEKTFNEFKEDFDTSIWRI